MENQKDPSKGLFCNQINLKIMLKYFPLIISSVISSIILFQSFFIAPSINKLIDNKQASRFLRYIWPKFFLLISFFSIVAIIVIHINNIKIEFSKLLYTLSFAFMLSCYLVTPLINKAKDNSKMRLWSILHTSTISLTLFTLIMNLLIVFEQLNNV